MWRSLHAVRTTWSLAGIKDAALAAAVLRARQRTLQFFDGLYMDLHHLAGHLATATGKGRIAEVCRDVQRLIGGEGARSPILAEGHVGASMALARGLSIYFPRVPERSTSYRELEFAAATRWAGFLGALLCDSRASEGTR